ncbi:hypothetical protein ACFFRR_005328 [Megaselia abdita]
MPTTQTPEEITTQWWSSDIAKAIKDKAFLDIEGAFNNVNADSIKKGLEDLKVDPVYTRWTMYMLTSRIVHSEVKNKKIEITISREHHKDVQYHPCFGWWCLALYLTNSKKEELRL